MEFKCIGAGRHDQPKYSNDGQWRLGLLINLFEETKVATILYMGELFTISTNQVRPQKE